jgi:hypothetical protein
MAEGSTASRDETDSKKAPGRPRRNDGRAKPTRAKSPPPPTSSASANSKRTTTPSSGRRSTTRPARKSSNRRTPASRRPDQPQPTGVRGAATADRPHAIEHQAHPMAKSIRDAGRRAAKPALAGATATAAIASATALIRAVRPKPRKVLGIPVRRTKMQAPNFKQTELTIKALTNNTSRLTGVDPHTAARTITRAGRQLARAGKQAGTLASDIERAGQTAERVGKLLAR